MICDFNQALIYSACYDFIRCQPELGFVTPVPETKIIC